MKICDCSYFYGLRWLLATVGLLSSWKAVQWALPCCFCTLSDASTSSSIQRPSKFLLIWTSSLAHWGCPHFPTSWTVTPWNCLLPFPKFSNRIRWRRDTGNCRALCVWVTLDWELWVEGTEMNVSWYFRQCWCRESKTNPVGCVAAQRDALENALTTHTAFYWGFKAMSSSFEHTLPVYFSLWTVYFPHQWGCWARLGYCQPVLVLPQAQCYRKPLQQSLITHFITWICASPRHLTGWPTTSSLAADFSKLLGGCLTALSQPMWMRHGVSEAGSNTH